MAHQQLFNPREAQVQKPKSRSAKNSQIPEDQNTLHVVERNSSTLYILPKEDVYLVPDSKRLVLCEYFNAADLVNSCRFGRDCRWVHADTTRAQRKHIHVNWAWRSLEECKYPKLPSGIKLEIREPPSTKSDIVDVVDSGYLLRTRCVFDDVKRPAAHCAHFYYGRECHLGALCDFAHVIYIDPNAYFGERAPPPCTFGRGRENQSANSKSKFVPQPVHSHPRQLSHSMYHSPGATQFSESRHFHSIENQNSVSHDLHATYGAAQAYASVPSWQEHVQQQEFSPMDDDDVPRAGSPCSLKDEDLAGDGHPLQCPQSQSVNNESISQPPATPGTPVVVATGKGRWRYNPYGGGAGDATPETAALTPGCPAFNFSMNTVPEFTLNASESQNIPSANASMGQVPPAVSEVLSKALSPATVDMIPVRPVQPLEPLTALPSAKVTPAFKFSGISSAHQLLPSWSQC